MVRSHDVFTLTETETYTETDKIGIYRIYQMKLITETVSVPEQYEHLHTIMYKPIFYGLCQCESIVTETGTDTITPVPNEHWCLGQYKHLWQCERTVRIM